MNTKKALQLLEKEMSRQEFLKLAGLVALGIVGLPQLLSLLHKSTVSKPTTQMSNGYGSRAYGV